ncbi:MAG: SUMF1/EgtB/PvdO family nonheme iron enzyme [Anaerolineales bacterium]|nr:SUMF1/EgtB/PvdO family nonheme iron enzyme [Anaerolineales bacterium]
MVMVYVPAAEFDMGSESGDSDELPVHTVYLDSYWIDQTEVTNVMYAQCVAAGACEAPSEYLMDQMSGYYSGPSTDDYPVVNIDWFRAEAYCTWAGARLPSEAEWELAARGTDGRTYPWGNDAPTDDLTNYFRHVGDLQPVGSYPDGASPYGALDMAGNAGEWVNDWFGETYYSQSPTSNPPGPESGEYRVIRGGSWFIIETYLRSTARLDGFTTPGYYYVDTGFRCALGATP